MATALQGLKELAYKITGKTPKSNTENGVITELANDYEGGDYYTKSETLGLILEKTYPKLDGVFILCAWNLDNQSITLPDGWRSERLFRACTESGLVVVASSDYIRKLIIVSADYHQSGTYTFFGITNMGTSAWFFKAVGTAQDIVVFAPTS